MSTAELLGAIGIDDLVARVLEQADVAGWLEEAIGPPAPPQERSAADRHEAAITGALGGPDGSSPQAAAVVLTSLAWLATADRFLPQWPARVVQGAFLELSALPGPWGALFAGAAERAATAVARQAAVRATKTPDDGSDGGARLHRVGRYAILGVLGRGASGTVYRARQDGTDRDVALKLLRGDAITPEVLARFGREAVLLGQLDHPAIAKVFDSGLADVHGDRVPFMALELVEGRSLLGHAALANCSDAQRIELVRQVAQAVQHAHDKGIVHRDLTPANVLVTADGRPKVIDFGIARILDPDLRTSALRTVTGAVIGTPAYMSPEQAKGDPERVDARTDVWALGVLLFELLTGRLPYDDIVGKPVTEVLRALAEEEPRRLRSLRPDLGADVDAVVGKALEPDRDNRYQAASALADDLGRLLSGAAVTARAPTAFESARRFVRRHPVVAWTTVSVVLLLATGLALSIAARKRTQRQLEVLTRLFKIPLAMADVLERSIVPTEKNLEMLAEIEQALPLLRDLPDSARFTELAATFQEQMGDAFMKQGEVVKAEDRFRKCRELWRGLVERDPNASRPGAKHATATAKVGDARAAQGARAEAEELYWTALRLDEELVARHPDDDELLDDLAWSWLRVAGAATRRDETGPACEHAARALHAIERALARKPGDEDRIFGLAAMTFELGYMLQRHGAAAHVVTPLYVRATEHRDELARQHADNSDYASTLWSIPLAAGAFWVRHGDLDRGVAALEQVLTTVRGFASVRQPTSTTCDAELQALSALITARLLRGDLAGARDVHAQRREALDRSTSLPAGLRREHTVIQLQSAGELAALQGAREEAERTWRQSLAACDAGWQARRALTLAHLARNGMASPAERAELEQDMARLEGTTNPLDAQSAIDLYQILGHTESAAELRQRLARDAAPTVARVREILAGGR